MPKAKPQISYETANKIATIWMTAIESQESASMRDVMKRAGLKAKDARTLNRYRRNTEEILGISLPSLNPSNQSSKLPRTTEKIYVDSAVVVIYSDAHFWPNQAGDAYWILLKILNELKPDFVIDNGDSFDAAEASRHAKISYEHLPSIKDEYEACLHYMDMIKEATPKSRFYRNIGNHDLRIEAKLAQYVPEFSGMPGFTTHEMFPGWEHNYSVAFNEMVMIKHRLFCGMHSAYHNVLKSGINMITSHTHRLQVRPWTDFRGTRYGIETGTIANIYGPQFSYTEDGLRDWQEGFVVVTIDGNEIYPETVSVKDGKARFRGKVYTV